jgi:hypothetical protein
MGDAEEMGQRLSGHHGSERCRQIVCIDDRVGAHEESDCLGDDVETEYRAWIWTRRCKEVSELRNGVGVESLMRDTRWLVITSRRKHPEEIAEKELDTDEGSNRALKTRTAVANKIKTSRTYVPLCYLSGTWWLPAATRRSLQLVVVVVMMMDDRR